MGEVVRLERSAYAHSDQMAALFLACKEAVRIHALTPEKATELVNAASRLDCAWTAAAKEAVLAVIQPHDFIR